MYGQGHNPVAQWGSELGSLVSELDTLPLGYHTPYKLKTILWLCDLSRPICDTLLCNTLLSSKHEVSGSQN